MKTLYLVPYSQRLARLQIATGDNAHQFGAEERFSGKGVELPCVQRCRGGSGAPSSFSNDMASESSGGDRDAQGWADFEDILMCATR